MKRLSISDHLIMQISMNIFNHLRLSALHSNIMCLAVCSDYPHKRPVGPSAKTSNFPKCFLRSPCPVKTKTACIHFFLVKRNNNNFSDNFILKKNQFVGISHRQYTRKIPKYCPIFEIY